LAGAVEERTGVEAAVAVDGAVVVNGADDVGGDAVATAAVSAGLRPGFFVDAAGSVTSSTSALEAADGIEVDIFLSKVKK
jgi:hypothetical protein